MDPTMDNELMHYGTPRHSDRTLDNLDVLFFRLDIAFFESIAGVALGSSDETGS